MARCEDFPCCGHDVCPDFSESGEQLNMRCVCGAEVHKHSRYSICVSCLNADSQDEDFREEEDEE